MTLTRNFQKICFRLRERFQTLLLSTARKLYWTLQGMSIGKGTTCPRLYVTWPHQVQIGEKCRIESGVFFKFDGIWQTGPRIIIGNHCFIGQNCEFNIRQEIRIAADCLIASGVKFIDHDHGTELGTPMRLQEGQEAAIAVESDVWIGTNAVILKGVTIGRGAIVAAGAVVNRSVLPYSIVGGIPARPIAMRAPLAPQESLQDSQTSF